jgi:predicted membrane-bound dolichyl-phosphate-mannose-protein mannosyltransferase
MAVQLDEKTEITVPLKTIISVIAAIVVASWYVSATQNKIADLEHAVKLADERFVSYTKQPGRNTTDVELLKKDFEYLRKEVDDLKNKGK